MSFAQSFIGRLLQGALLLTAAQLAFAQGQAPNAGQFAIHPPTDTYLKWLPCSAPMPTGCTYAVLHGDPAKPNADTFVKLPGRSIIPMHTHTSAERMFLVSGELDVSYTPGRNQRIKAGSYAYGPAGVPHTGVCMSVEPCVLFIAYEAPVDATLVVPPKK
jgi:quercetin dioxygenase-like cupin family protein